MPNTNKIRGSLFEYQIKWSLEMLSFYVIRSYSSIGVADLVATPSWNSRGNYRPLLIQCKNQKSKDYIRPMESDHLDYLQMINSGLVVVIYKDESKVMVKEWESGIKSTFAEFLLKHYGIRCKYSELLSKFKSYNRPIHLYKIDVDEKNRSLGSFQDFLSVEVYYPHIPQHHRSKHEFY